MIPNAAVRGAFLSDPLDGVVGNLGSGLGEFLLLFDDFRQGA